MNKPSRTIYNHVTTLLLLCVTWLFTACADDFPVGGKFGDGEAQVSASVEFEPLTPALDESRGTAGNAIKYIENLTLFIYSGEGTLMKILNNDQLSDWKIEKDVSVTLPGGEKSDGYGEANQTQAESTTCRATFNIPLEYGRYMIYAVANMGTFETDEESMKKFRTPDELKKITVEWQNNVASNNVMFGYMTATGTENETSAGFDASPVAVNSPRVNLHAWLKRTASKVTVAYDGSGLKNGIQIYIKSVTIKDIPKYCKIGENNTVSKEYNELISNGESILYGEKGELEPGTTDNGTDFHKWMVVNKGNGLQGAVTRDENGKVKTAHSETNQALYFFENLQGDYKNAPNKEYYDKKQNWNDVGTNITKPDQPDYKDNIPYGTYIEVEAYYSAMVTAEDSKPNEDPEYTYVSNGKIKYRFMLGQDVDYNYNAYRNHHYKLTLGFKGYANQPDWHIEYIEEEPSIATPPIFYVPYTYYQKSMFPIRLVGDCISLEAEIIENNWAPYDPNVGPGQDSVPPALVGPDSNPLSFRWARSVYEGTQSGKDLTYNLQYRWSSDGTTQETSGSKVTPIWAGFLALAVPQEYNDPSTEIPATLFSNATHSYTHLSARQALKSHYYDNHQNIRSFTEAELKGESVGTGRNQAIISHAEDGTTTVTIPLWTRAKTLLGISGFSGNNPYDTYQRKAVVRYTAKFRTGSTTKTIVREVPVYQVRRVVNPKGVWRKAADNSSFHVRLSRRENPEPTTNFTTFASEGAWRAYISEQSETAQGFISLRGGERVENGVVYGNTGSDIDFYVDFNGKTTTGNTHCAIITIEYHGYTCIHKLFVRQGYLTPITILGNAEWSSFSLYSANLSYEDAVSSNYSANNYYDATITANPLTLGTLFKRANFNQGILVKNNDREGYGPLEKIAGKNLWLSNGTESTWAYIKGLAYSTRSYSLPTTDDAWTDIDNLTNAIHQEWEFPRFRANVSVNGKLETRYYTVPTYEQYRSLELNADFGLGVLYADGATDTALNLNTAFGFTDNDNDDNDGKGSACGMRGIIVYNPKNAHQIFFPLGKNGIGRRTVAPISSSMKWDMMGYLRYGALTTTLSTTGDDIYRPIPYNLPASPGAIYWIKKSTGNAESTPEKNRLGWDMNYFDFNFNSYDYAVGFATNGDALPIRLVRCDPPSDN